MSIMDKMAEAFCNAWEQCRGTEQVERIQSAFVEQGERMATAIIEAFTPKQ